MANGIFLQTNVKSAPFSTSTFVVLMFLIFELNLTSYTRTINRDMIR